MTGQREAVDRDAIRSSNPLLPCLPPWPVCGRTGGGCRPYHVRAHMLTDWTQRPNGLWTYDLISITLQLPARLWSSDNDLQPLCALGAARRLGKPVPGACWERTIHRHADDRLHARESAPLGGGWKRGEQKQAVGRSRGGRNTKIHALADVKGRLIAILLTGGEAHDCPVAELLVRRVKPAKHMLGDKAYDSAELT